MIKIVRAALIGAACLLSMTVLAQSAVPPSPSPTAASPSSTPPGPDVRGKITDDYAALVARDAYFWAWPMVNPTNPRPAPPPVTNTVPPTPHPRPPLTP